MKNIVLLVLFSLRVFPSVSLGASELQLFPLMGDSPPTEPETVIPFAPPSTLFSDFGRRLRIGIETQNLATIQALYQTNGVTTEEFEPELARWRHLLVYYSKARVSVYFKDFSKLPAKALQIWSEQARRLTRRDATHLAFVGSEGEITLMLPLVAVEDKLLIVPSEKVTAKFAVGPAGRGEPPTR